MTHKPFCTSSTCLISPLILYFLVSGSASACVFVNEVYAQDPEWVEIHNTCNMQLNLSSWFISDLDSSDSITCHVIPNCSLETNDTYFVILGRKYNITDVTNETISYFYVDDKSIGSGLNNGGDQITFYNSSYSFYMNYSGSSNGKSWSMCSGSWSEIENETPGKENYCANGDDNEENIVLNVFIDSVIIKGVAYDQLFKIEIENKKNCSEKDNTTVNYNVKNSIGIMLINHSFTREVGCSGYANTGYWQPNETGTFELCGGIASSTVNDTNPDDDYACKNVSVIDPLEIACDLQISLELDDFLVESGDRTYYHIILNDSICNRTGRPVEIIYWIEDLFGNVVPGYPKNTITEIECSKNLNKQWTPPSIIGSEAYYIKANISNPFCNDSNNSNNFIQKMMVVKGVDYNPETSSYVKIKNINLGSDERAKFGEDVLAELEVYKGDTAKYAVHIWAESLGGESVSKKSKVHVHSKYTEYKLSVPVSLKPNCKGRYPDGTYRMVVDGLDYYDSINFRIEGISSSSCEVRYKHGETFNIKTKPEKKASQKTGEQLIELVSYQENVSAGGMMETRLKLKNILGTTENFSVYSYVLNGTRCLSLGFDGKSWKNTWTANKKTMKLSPGSSVNLTLVNMIENGTDSGVYKFRVRLKYGGKTKDLTRDIIITPNLNNISRTTFQEKANVTESPKQDSKSQITGRIVSKEIDMLSFFLKIYSNIASWFVSIFKF